MKFSRRFWSAATAVAFAGSLAAPVAAQQVADPGFKSVGRGAPVAAALPSVTLPLGRRAANADPAEIQRTMEALNSYPFLPAKSSSNINSAVGLLEVLASLTCGQQEDAVQDFGVGDAGRVEASRRL